MENTNEKIALAAINQLEEDFEENEYDGIEELFLKLMEASEENKKIIIDFLSEERQSTL